MSILRVVCHSSSFPGWLNVAVVTEPHHTGVRRGAVGSEGAGRKTPVSQMLQARSCVIEVEML